MVWESRPCAFCGHFVGYANDSLGPLIGPIGNERTGEEFYVHRLCALWSPEVYQTEQGTLCGIMASIRRSRAIRCSVCSQRGASIGCRIERCSHSFHLECAGKRGCLFNAETYMVACPVHAAKFKHEVQQKRVMSYSPEEDAGEGRGGEARRFRAREVHQQRKRPLMEPILMARVAARKARIEARDRAAESSDDEEHFQRKEQQRLIRDKAKLNPLILGGRKEAVAGPQPHGIPPPEIAPANVPSDGWSAVGGLHDVIKQLKEMVLLPLIYPELFRDMGLTPPRGILFHGVPGSGKTLAARALAGACAQHSPAPVAFFARKGADCLGKFSGEAERTLRLLFEEAAKQAPAIIFLDELDGLVPARSTREGSSDQIYASVVASLLALMDGAGDRGAVVVIGATNRLEAIDPALRRPGRFDREVYFGLPSCADRKAILKVHTSKWESQPSEQTLAAVAAATDGFAGADLQALCTAAVMVAVRRNAPRLVDHLEGLTARLPAQRACGNAEGNATVVTSAHIENFTTQAPQQAVVPEGVDADGGASIVQRPVHTTEEGMGTNMWDLQDCEPGSAQRTGAESEGDQMGGSAAAVPAWPSSSAAAQNAGGAAHRARGSAAALLDSIAVKVCDWRTALSQAPAPCSSRQGMASVAADYAHAMPHHLQPLLLPALAASLSTLHSAGLSLPPSAAAAAKLAAAGKLEAAGGWSALEGKLVELGALVAASSNGTGALPSNRQNLDSSPTADAAEGEALPGQQCYHPFRLLLAGEGELGQEAAAGALLRLLEGLEVHAISLPALIVAGNGDACQGCVSLIHEALRRATTQKPCLFYLPRLEAWAQNTVALVDGDSSDELMGASPAGPSSVRRQSPPSRFYSPGASVFRGLVSLEERGHDSPAAAWTTATPRTPRSAGAATSRGSNARNAMLGSPRTRPTPPEYGVESAGTAALASLQPEGAERNLPWALSGLRSAAAMDSLPDVLPKIQTPRVVQGLRESVTGASLGGFAPTTPGSQCKDMEMEAVVLSEVWKVFEQLMKEVPASQPVIIMGTCHCKPQDFPPALEAFFTGRPVPSEDAPMSARVEADSPWVVHIAPAEEAAWKEALLRAADAASASLAVQGAEALWAGFAAQSTTSEPRESSPARIVPEVTQEEAAAKNAQEEEAAVLKNGARLFSQVAEGIRRFASKMADDSRAETAAAVLTQRKGAKEARRVSLADLAVRASHGRVPILADFLAEIEQISAAVRVFCQNERGYSARAAAASALQDEAQQWAHALVQRLRLTDPANVRALRAAEAKVKAQQAAAALQKGPSRPPSLPPYVPGQAGTGAEPAEQAAPSLAALNAEGAKPAPNQMAEDGSTFAKTQEHTNGGLRNAGRQPGPSGDTRRLAAEHDDRQEGRRGQQGEAEADLNVTAAAEPGNPEEQGRACVQTGAVPVLGRKGWQVDAKGCKTSVLRSRFMHLALPALREALQEPLRAAFLASGCSENADLGRLEGLVAAATVAGSAVLSEPGVLQDCRSVALDPDDTDGFLVCT